MLLLFFLPFVSASGIGCKDNHGNDVDWFIFYKLPMIPGHENGTDLLYMDSNNKKWALLDHGIDTNQQALYYTLDQYYKMDASKTFSLMYNDEWPDSTIWSNNSGHCKGVTVFDRQSGFWLIHSVPKFPSNNTYGYPPNAHRYGQHGICVSFNYDALNDISTQLFYINPFTYQLNLPPFFQNNFPALVDLSRGKQQTTEPFSSQKVLKSARGAASFKHFAKANGFGKDLYFDLVAPVLKTSLKTETWQHGNLNIFSQCTPDHSGDVLNAKSISLPFGVKFDNYNDHSKFAVAFTDRPGSNPVPYVCIGDINRQEHQTARGGGTMCLYDFAVHDVYSTVVSDVYQCSGH